MNQRPTDKRLSHDTELVIPFHDVDSAAIVWHGHYVKYLEVARCELLDKFDYNYNAMIESGYFWPVIDLRLKYVAPGSFAQRILISSTIVEWQNRLKINYLIRCAETEKKLTKGYTIQVAIDIESREMLFESPNVLFERLGVDND